MIQTVATQWSARSRADAIAHFKTDVVVGLSFEEAVARLKQYGRNEFAREKRGRFFRLLWKQFKSPLVFVLLVAGMVTFVLAEYIDMTVIFLAVFINMAVGVFQEGRASRAFEKLKASQEKRAIVFRDGKKIEIAAAELVPGDIIFLESGKIIPADSRLLSDNNLSVNEAVLTGEWLDVSKDASKKTRGRITEQENMAWMGTLVSAGQGRGVVVATGSATEIGRIAESIAGVKDETTPLQRNIKKIAYFLSAILGIIIVLIAVLGVVRGASIVQMFLTAVAIAIAALPEGLPAAVTVVLALGMEQVLKHGGLVRNLLAAETLGSTTVILTDKTGTLTEAKMAVAHVAPYTSIATIQERAHAPARVLDTDDEREVLQCAVYASDAFIEWKSTQEKEGEGSTGNKTRKRDIEPPALVRANSFVVHGRPVERAIVLAGLENGINQEVLFRTHERIDFLPFESGRRVSLSLHEWGDQNRLIIAGAPETIVEHAQKIYESGGERELTDQIKEELRSFQEVQSARGVRMVALAYKSTYAHTIVEEVKSGTAPDLDGFVFGGFILLTDPVRADVAQSISQAKKAGVRVIMLTGDHPATARAVAEDVGIARSGDRVVVGTEMDAMTDKELHRTLAAEHIFARVLPNEKLRIARILKAKGEVVAMTGDGINDAPALRSADIGIALGSGTDVAKEASDLVLLDNGFDIIVHAIEEGRRIIDNLKKIVAYLLSTGFSEIFVVGAAVVAGAALPILPAQILWINIIEEGFMNFAFAFEPKEKGVMLRNPRALGASILTPNLKKLIAIIALVTGTFLIALYFTLTRIGMPIEEIRTIMFVALAVDSIFFSLSMKNLHRPLWRINMFSNRYLLFALGLSFAALIASLTVPFLQTLLSLTAFSPVILAFLVGLGIFNMMMIEFVKYIVFEVKGGVAAAAD